MSSDAPNSRAARRGERPRRSLSLLRGLAASAIVGVTAALVVHEGVPRTPSSTEVSPVTVVAERRTIQDVLTLRGAVEGRHLPDLIAVGGGRVTAMHMVEGDTIEGGQALLDVDGEPVVATPGTMPYWRNLEVGLRGVDVEQLEFALAADGYDPGVIDDTYSGATRAAVKVWQRDRGLPETGVFRADRAVVAPWPVRVRTIGVAVGAAVVPDSVIAEVATVEPVAALTASPAEQQRLVVGQTATLTLASGGEPFGGTVAEVGEVPIDQEGATDPQYPVVVELSDPGDAPTTTRTAIRAEILINETVDAVTVPVAAVGTGAEGEPVVTVVDRGEQRQIAVTLGLQDAGYVEIRSGLDGGERVVLELE